MLVKDHWFKEFKVAASLDRTESLIITIEGQVTRTLSWLPCTSYSRLPCASTEQLHSVIQLDSFSCHRPVEARRVRLVVRWRRRPRGSVGIAAFLCRWQTAGGGSIPRWSASKTQDRRPAERQRGSDKKKLGGRWRHLCLTPLSRCNGHPTGRSESSRHPSPFCSIMVPKRGTSILVFRLICGRLQCHGSGARCRKSAVHRSAVRSNAFSKFPTELRRWTRTSTTHTKHKRRA